MVARNPARYLAPVALVATVVATVVIVQDGLDSHTATHARGLTQVPSRPRHTASTPATYVVQSGDSLSAISVKTGVSVPTLEALNPGVDPAALQTGQRLRLRR